MTIIPAFWVQMSGEFPVIQKDARVPFLLLGENGHDILFPRNKTTVLFKFTEISANTQDSSVLKTEITKLMKTLYDTWDGMLPDQGHAQFYGYLRGGLMSHVDPNPTNTIHWIHIGLGYSTYQVGDLYYGDPEKVRALCEANQLPMELVVP